MPRARGASKLANGVPLDSLAPGEKRALGLGPEGFPLDGEALAETGLDKPLVSLDPQGKPVLSPAAAEEVARVSPELARRMEATERDVSAQPAAAEGDPETAGGTGSGMPDGPAGPVAGKGAAPPAGPPLSKPRAAPPEPAKGQRVSFLRDGVEVQGKVTASIGDGGFVVETADNVKVMRGADLTLLPDAPKAAKATKKNPKSAGKPGPILPKGPPPPRPAPYPHVVVNGKTLPAPEWVREDHGNEDAKAYEAGIPGGAPGWAPRLSATDAEGTKTAKFDGAEGDTLIDRKRRITFRPRAIEEALRQSAVAAMNGYKIRWEVPNEKERRQAERLFKEWGIKNIEVRIHPMH